MANLANRSLGRWGEDRAVTHFRALGFELIERNWRSPDRELPGEIDVIVSHRSRRLLVFCEVKTRRSNGFGGAVSAVDQVKQAKLRALAEAWLRHHDPGEIDVRFDVVAIDGVRLTHHESAF
jgi:putative endonuclease